MATEQTRMAGTAAAPEARLEDRLIRDLVAAYPATMEILAPLGIDLCCGGGHPLGVALDLHGIDREPVLAQVAGIVEAADGPSR